MFTGVCHNAGSSSEIHLNVQNTFQPFQVLWGKLINVLLNNEALN